MKFSLGDLFGSSLSFFSGIIKIGIALIDIYSCCILLVPLYFLLHIVYLI